MGAMGGFETAEVGVRADVCWDRGLGCFTEFESWRGLGGRGGREDDGDGFVNEIDSLEGLRNATGFRGGGGADLVLVVDAVDMRCPWVSAIVSVFTRRIAGECSSSSSEERSMRLCTSGVGPDVRSGSFGRDSGWSLSFCADVD